MKSDIYIIVIDEELLRNGGIIMKRSCLIILMLIILSFTACNTYKTDIDGVGSENSIFTDYKYDKEAVQSPYGVTRMAIAQNGYYYVVDNILYFYNINSDVNMPLCSKLNCKHDSNDCDAYVNSIDATTGKFECNCMENKIFYYNDFIYCIEITKDRDYYLYQYDSVFSNKKKVMKLASMKDDKSMVCDARAALISDGYLYYYTTLMDEKYAQNGYVSTFQCNRIKLEENATREVIDDFSFPGDYALGAGMSNGLAICSSDNKIYFYAGGVARSYSQNDSVQYRVAVFDKSTQQFNVLWSYKGNETNDVFGDGTGDASSLSGGEYVKMDKQGNFYIVNKDSNGKNIIIKKNFEKGTAEVIYTAQMDEICSLQSDGENLYFFECSYGKNAKSYLVSVSVDGKVNSKYEILYDEGYLSYMEDFYKKNPDSNFGMPSASGIVFYGVDDRYIMIGCKEDSNVFKGLTSSNIFKTSKKADKTAGVGLINRSDYLNSKELSIKQIYQFVP